MDGVINFLDFSILARQWLNEPGIPSADIAPIKGDDFVNLLDFVKMSEKWMETVE